MVDLTASADFFKRSALWILLGIVGLIIIITLYMYRSAIQTAFFPPKALPATVAFGILPKFDFSVGYPPAGNISYDLQTVSGGLPSFMSNAKVFAINNVDKASFSSPDEIKRKAAGLGFNTAPQIVGQRMIFNDSLNRTLTADFITGDMTLTSDYLNNPDLLSTRVDSVERAKLFAQNFMANAGLNIVEYPADKAQVNYYRLNGGSLTKANSLSNSNLIGLNYLNADLDKIPVITTDKNDNLVSVLVSNQSVVEASYQPLNVNKGLFATYPLKSASQAYEELKSGNAAFNQQVNESSLTITSIGLGYVAESQSGYLIPVYVFNMSNGSFAFVPAVDNNWMQR